MLGTNVYKLNQASLEEAVRQYLEREWSREDFAVAGVKAQTVGYDTVYEVTINMKENENGAGA